PSASPPTATTSQKSKPNPSAGSGRTVSPWQASRCSTATTVPANPSWPCKLPPVSPLANPCPTAHPPSREASSSSLPTPTPSLTNSKSSPPSGPTSRASKSSHSSSRPPQNFTPAATDPSLSPKTISTSTKPSC